jgi:hypothetical protein
MGAGFVFRPAELKTFSIRRTDVVMSNRFLACADCGLIWSELPVDKLRRVITNRGKLELKQRLEL